jgi:diguanylate cyclase (GGDEF)-like protein
VQGFPLVSAGRSINGSNSVALHAIAEPLPDPLAGGELGLITRDVALRTGAQAGVLAGWSEAEELVDVICAWGAAPIHGRLPFPAGQRSSLVGRVLKTGHAAFEPIDTDQDQIFGAQGSGPRITHAAGAAVTAPSGSPAVLCIGFSVRPRYDAATTLWMLEQYAGLAALCQHDRGALEGLLEAARRDGLTGLLNYAAVVAELHREIGRSARHGRPLSCCFIDLDGFKQINDRHGHLYGSGVLADLAILLRDGVRIGDTLGRYGGDEFIAILPDTDYEAASVLADRLRSTISTTRLDGTEDSLTASVGVTEWRVDITADEMLASADEALRTAKRQGGGLVVGAGGVAGGAIRDAAGGARSHG